jgi:hypothetical protein
MVIVSECICEDIVVRGTTITLLYYNMKLFERI